MGGERAEQADAIRQFAERYQAIEGGGDVNLSSARCRERQWLELLGVERERGWLTRRCGMEREPVRHIIRETGRGPPQLWTSSDDLAEQRRTIARPVSVESWTRLCVVLEALFMRLAEAKHHDHLIDVPDTNCMALPAL